MLLVLLSLSACSKCGSQSSADAAVDAGPARAGTSAHSVDFRTVIVWIFPEYRGTAVLETTATLTRQVPGLTAAQRDAGLASLRWEDAEDGGWRFSTFHLSQVSDDTLALTVSYDVEQLGHLYIAPTGLTTEEFGLYFPRNVKPGREHFDFNVRYASSPERSRELIRQAATLLVASKQWKLVTPPDEWTDAMPASTTEMVVLQGTDGATITYERTGGRVFAHYALDTR
ncbi:MAG: hypothetical protein QM817_39180 [Archangium sp.]